MADLVAVAFDDETTAFELRAELAKLQKEYLIEMNDSRLPDFGGLKLGIVRKVATGKAVEATREFLQMYQTMLSK